MASLAHWLDFPLAFYPVAVVAILASGVAKGGFGTGSGGLGVPLMSIFIAPPEAAGIMLPILCAMDIFSVYAYRRHWSAKHLWFMLPGAVVGIVAGGFAFGALPVNAIRLLIGLIAVAFAVNQWFVLAERLARRLSTRQGPPGRVAGAIWGSLSGFTSTLAHAGGPPFAAYILAQKLDKTLIVGTSVFFFFVVNYLKLVPYYFLGQLNEGNLVASALFAPLAPMGIWIGIWLHRRISERAFYRVSYAILFATGAKLIFDAATH